MRGAYMPIYNPNIVTGVFSLKHSLSLYFSRETFASLQHSGLFSHSSILGLEEVLTWQGKTTGRSWLRQSLSSAASSDSNSDQQGRHVSTPQRQQCEHRLRLYRLQHHQWEKGKGTSLSCVLKLEEEGGGWEEKETRDKKLWKLTSWLGIPPAVWISG